MSANLAPPKYTWPRILKGGPDPWRDEPLPPGHVEAAAAVAAKIAAGERLPGTKPRWRSYYAALATGTKDIRNRREQ